MAGCEVGHNYYRLSIIIMTAIYDFQVELRLVLEYADMGLVKEREELSQSNVMK